MSERTPCPRHGPQVTGTDGKGWRYCSVAGCGWQAPAVGPEPLPEAERLCAVVDTLTAERDELRELCATVNGDGGHRQVEVGTVKAVKAAKERFSGLVKERDALREVLGRVVSPGPSLNDYRGSGTWLFCEKCGGRATASGYDDKARRTVQHRSGCRLGAEEDARTLLGGEEAAMSIAHEDGGVVLTAAELESVRDRGWRWATLRPAVKAAPIESLIVTIEALEEDISRAAELGAFFGAEPGENPSDAAAKALEALREENGEE